MAGNGNGIQLSQLSPADEAVEDEELEPRLAATIPFVRTSPQDSPKLPAAGGLSSVSPASLNLLKTPLDVRRSGAGSRGSRPGSRRFSGNIELDALSVYELYDTGSRRPSALDILSHTGSEGAQGEEGVVVSC